MSTVTSPGPPLTGLMQFRVDGQNDGPPRALDAGGHAAYTPAFLLDVGDVVSATYSGDAALGWSTGEAPLDVLPASTATTLVSSRNPVTRGEQTDILVTVANTDTDIAPFGSVQFSIDGDAHRPRLDLDENGQADVGLVANVPAGSYTVRVDYVDDTAEIADFRPSSASFVQRVTDRRRRRPPRRPSSSHRRRRAQGRSRPLRSADREGAAKRGVSPPCAAVRRSSRPPSPARCRRRSTRGADPPPREPSRVRRTLIAAGRHTFASPGSSRLRLRLTGKGKRLIRHAKRLDVEIRTRFVPTSGSAVSAVKRVRVTRRGRTRARPARVRDRGGSAPGGRVVLRLGSEEPPTMTTGRSK